MSSILLASSNTFAMSSNQNESAKQEELIEYVRARLFQPLRAQLNQPM